MSYKFSELEQAKKDFEAVFNAGLGNFLEDRIILVALLRVLYNPVAFDKYLERTHPEIIDSGMSQIQIVEKYYGVAGVELIIKLSP
jgi:predicted acetyltransferase